MARVTLKDVAKKAGLGVATVDRVLNARAPVSPDATARVLAAADALGYRARGLLRRRIAEMAPAKRLGFVLQKEGKWFYQELATQIRCAAEKLPTIRATVDIAFVESLSPSDLANCVEHMASRVDAIGLVAVDHPLVTEAVEAAAIPVFALLSPLSSPKVAGFVGIDGRKAGRTAGWAMARLTSGSGQVGILIGSHRYLGHEALEVGFRSYLREYAPGLALRDSVVYLDDAAVAYEAAAELLRVAPDLAGLYHCGGGVSGALAAITEAGRANDLCYICHELTPVTSKALVAGGVDLVIANPIDRVADRIARLMARQLTDRTGPGMDGIIPFQILTPENL